MNALAAPAQTSWFWGLTRAQRTLLVASGAALVGGAVYKLSQRRRRGLAPAGPPECDVVDPSGGQVAGVRYIERIAGDVDPNAQLPMVIVFHSRGSKPEHFGSFHKTLKGPARVILPQGPFAAGDNWSWFKLGAATKDQETLTEQMRETGEIMAKFLADIVRCRPTLGRPVVTGSSQGGSMTYLMASLYPYLVKGGVALLGWLPRDLWTPHMAQTVGLHGTQDTTVPYEPTAEYWETMFNKGAPFIFNVYDTGHSVSSEMRSDWRTHVNAMLGYS